MNTVIIYMQVVSSETYNIKDSYSLTDKITTTTTEGYKDPSYNDKELPIPIPHVNKPLYPGFRKFFYVALFIVLMTVTVVVVDLVRTLRKDRKTKKEGRQTYQKVLPNV